MSKTNEPPHERASHVDGVGMVRITTAQCTCGRLVQPSDFQASGDDGYSLRVICPACHHDVFAVE